MKELSAEKTMTVAEVASVMGVSGETIRLYIKELFPDKLKTGKTTYLNETEVTAVKIKIQGGVNLQKNLEVGQTELERRMIVQSAIQIMQEDIELLTKENAQLKQENKLLLPKADFYDAVTDSSNTCDMSTVAKVLHMGIGRTKLFDLLRNKGILQSNNVPYQKYIDAGYFRVIESKYTLPNGDVQVNFKTVVYQKGVDYIRKILQGGK